jgi:cytochrome c553
MKTIITVLCVLAVLYIALPGFRLEVDTQVVPTLASSVKSAHTKGCSVCHKGEEK